MGSPIGSGPSETRARGSASFCFLCSLPVPEPFAQVTQGLGLRGAKGRLCFLMSQELQPSQARPSLGSDRAPKRGGMEEGPVGGQEGRTRCVIWEIQCKMKIRGSLLKFLNFRVALTGHSTNQARGPSKGRVLPRAGHASMKPACGRAGCSRRWYFSRTTHSRGREELGLLMC